MQDIVEIGRCLIGLAMPWLPLADPARFRLGPMKLTQGKVDIAGADFRFSRVPENGRPFDGPSLIFIQRWAEMPCERLALPTAWVHPETVL